MRLKYHILPLFCLSILFFSCRPVPPEVQADLIVHNAVVWTANEQQPEAEALAIAGDTLIAVGKEKEIMVYRGEKTQIIDASRQFITPGFIDCHVHFLTGGFRLSSVQLRDAATPEVFIQRIRDFAATLEPGDWITGGDWDHENWGGELPTKEWIDEFTPDNPVFINRLDGHMALANSAALKAAGISADSVIVDIEGGAIIRDENGELTGIFKDNAMSLIEPFIAELSGEQKDRALQAAMEYVASKGVTSVHSVGDGLGEMAVFERAREAEKLMTRIYAMIPLSNWPALQNKIGTEGSGDKWLKIGGLKGFVDGSLGSHTAAFFKPYSDSPGEKGLLVNTETDLYEWISGADQAGLQVAVHAIGDRANRILLDIYERVTKENGPRDRRFRIEHAQHISYSDMNRFAELNVIPSMQPYHVIDDGRWAEKVIGSKRSKTTYPFRSLLDAGARLAFGSDWFVAPPTPLDGIYAALTRRTLDDARPNGWTPEQKIEIDEALRAYTINAAYASFEEDRKGSLEVGKLADFVIMEQDLRRIAPEMIREVKITMTIVGGKTVYRR